MKLLEVTQDIVALDNILQTEEGRTEIDNHSNAQSLDEEVEGNMLTEQIHKTLSTLKERERQIISLRFGLVDDRERTLEEVGAIFNVTRERIRQIESKVLQKLRHPSRSKNLKEFLFEID